MRSKAYYARAHLMLVLPTFAPLPDDGPSVAILSTLYKKLASRRLNEGSGSVR